ncbi:galactose mutarotase-like domain-containing protein [Chytriomyces sp. MP71]|nr:galactose mutarotase-like domain-containing protein [Chytriomyces sp. MP71]
MASGDDDVELDHGGLRVAIRPLGATIARLLVRSGDGSARDVVLGFASAARQEADAAHPYFGTIGRVANRIANARFSLDGTTEFALARNSGPHCLHGGSVGFDSRVWTVVATAANAVTLQIDSRDGDEGFPGHVRASIEYSIQASTAEQPAGLSISYKVESMDSKVSIANLTTHSYFNLSGLHKESILDHVAHFPNVKGHLLTDDTQIPTGELVPTGQDSAMDFTSAPKAFGRDFQHVQQFRGYDHFYVLRDVDADFTAAEKKLQLAASVSSPESGITMECWTDAVGFQLYTGNWLDGTVTGKPGSQPEGAFCGPHSGFCIEASAPPDAINSKSEHVRGTVIVQADKPWMQRTLYTFSII